MHANANLFLRRQYPALCVSFISSKIRDGVQNRLAGSIYNDFPWVSRGKEESKCVVSACTKKTIRYNRFLGGETRHRTTENFVVRSARLAQTDGIKSSEARGGWRGELKFSIASTAPPILHSPVLTGTWQQDCSLSARVNALALCKPSIGKIDGHLTVTPPASGGAWRSMEKDSRAISYDKSIVPSATVRI